MTRKQQLTALAKRVEGLSGPDREVDALVWWLAGDGKVLWPHHADKEPLHACGLIWGCNPKEPATWGNVFFGGPNFTASLDAAMSLVPEGWTRDVDATLPEAGIDVQLHKRDTKITVKGTSLSEPCATVAAALRAIAEEEQ